MADNRFTNQDDEIAAAVAARKVELEAYQQRVVAADEDPTGYSPDYSDRDGEDLDNDGLAWNKDKRQYVSTGASTAPIVVANWQWDYWTIDSASDNLALTSNSPWPQFRSFGIPWGSAKWDDPQYGAVKYQNPEYPGNAGGNGQEWQMIPAGHHVRSAVTLWLSKYYGAHAATDIVEYSCALSIDFWPDPWTTQNGISFFGASMGGIRNDNPPYSWSTLPIVGNSEGASAVAELILPYDAFVAPNLSLSVNTYDGTALTDAVFHLCSMSYTLLDLGPV